MRPQSHVLSAVMWPTSSSDDLSGSGRKQILEPPLTCPNLVDESPAHSYAHTDGHTGERSLNTWVRTIGLFCYLGRRKGKERLAHVYFLICKSPSFFVKGNGIDCLFLCLFGLGLTPRGQDRWIEIKHFRAI